MSGTIPEQRTIAETLECLDNFLNAYPEDVFPTPPPELRARNAAAADVMHRVAYPVIRDAREDIERLRLLVDCFVDDGDCHFDHHGYCQEHGWFDESECPHARAKRLLDL